MAEMKRESARVLGTKPGTSSSGSSPKFFKALTAEEKAKHEAETQAAYEVWRREREERIARRRLAQYTKKTVFM